ncbi:MAG: hypothetical protein E7510_09760 [Ruminococcus sp.]|nr:hypothetical protein [Ruminococcus sp.]
MENKQITLSDVERNKELFEYEMTEVILQLRGEFAKISGKDMKLGNIQMKVPDININAELPSVNTVSLEVQTPVAVSSQAVAIPPVTIEKPDVNCPTVPAVNLISIDEIILDQIQLDCPTAIESFDTGDICVNVEPPIISEIDTKINIHLPDKSILIDKNDVPDIAVKHVPLIAINATTNVNVQKIVIDLPKTDITDRSVESDICFVLNSVSVDVPHIPKIKQYKGSGVVIEEAVHNFKDTAHVIPKIPEYTHQEPKMQSISINIAEVPVISSIDFKKIVLPDTPIDVRIVSKVNVTVPQSVVTKHEQISLPVIPGVKLPVTLQVTEPHVDIDTLPDVPVIDISIGTDMSIDIEKTNISYEYSTVCFSSLPDIEVQKEFGIEVPEIPDLSDAIKEVLESVV